MAFSSAVQFNCSHHRCLLPTPCPAKRMQRPWAAEVIATGPNTPSACHCLNLLLLPKLAVLTLPKLAITLSIMRRNACRVKQSLLCQRLANYSSSFGYKYLSEYQPHSVSSLSPSCSSFRSLFVDHGRVLFFLYIFVLLLRFFHLCQDLQVAVVAERRDITDNSQPDDSDPRHGR